MPGLLRWPVSLTFLPARDNRTNALLRGISPEFWAENRYLCGPRITEADWRLFPTLVRFDAVYVGHFKCNLRRIADYPNLSGYVRDLYQQPGIAETVDLPYIKKHYYGSHETVNPTRIVAVGPMLDYMAPHGRG